MIIPELSSLYKNMELISQGAYAGIYKAVDILTNEKVVIKKILKKDIWNDLQCFKAVLLSLSCEQIVKIIDFKTIEESNYIIEQYVDGCTLHNYMDSVSIGDFINIAGDMLKACNYLKSRELVHMDIKPANIMYKPEEGKAVLIDLDFMYLANKKFKFVGTLKFSAPEQILNNQVSSGSDIYSLGMVLYDLIQGFNRNQRIKEGILNKVDNKINLNFENLTSTVISDKIADLISRMLEYYPEKRITGEEALILVNQIREAIANTEIRDLPLRQNKAIRSKKDQDESIDFTHTERILNETILLKDSAGQNMKNTPASFVSSDRSRSQSGSKSINEKNQQKSKLKLYQNQLLKEYDSILYQAKVTFWLWVAAFVICYSIILTAVVLICIGRYVEALITVVLEALIYAVQRLFSIKEDHYRELINGKIKHLEIGDFMDYAFDKMEYIDDNEEKDKKVSEFIDSIRKRTEMS